MQIIPQKIEYVLEIMNHSMKATVIHTEEDREISFYFDDKVVSQKNMPKGELLSDDDCLCDIVKEYCNNKEGVYADIFKRHSDKVKLISKTIDVTVENYGINIGTHVYVERGRYTVDLVTNNGEDKFTGHFKAENFSEVLEKLRLVVSTMDMVGTDLAQNINELADDKVEEWIKWKE